MTNLIQHWRDTRLAIKLSILTSVIVVITVLLLTFLLIEREKNSFRNDLEANADQLLNTIAYNVRTPLFNREQDELDAVADVVKANENITQVRIYGASGTVYASTISEERVFAASSDPFVADILALDDDRILYQWEDDQLIAGRNVLVGRNQQGAVLIGLSTNSLDERVARFQQNSAGAAIVVVAAGLFLTFLFARQITRPIQTLSAAAQKMSSGDLKVRVPNDSNDEVGQLTNAFNVMVEQLEKREQELKGFTTQLEHRVLERTAELHSTTIDLRKSNKELEQLNKDLEEARLKAVEASRLKSEFLASISHELRTPLNAVIGYSQLMLRGVGGELGEKHTKNMERIESNGNHLLRLINDLLDLAKIESGRTELVIGPFDVRKMVNDVKQQTQSLALEKNLTYEVVVDEKMPQTIKGDVARIQQIIINLISNSMKFTEEGAVTVNIAKTDDTHWKLSVVDTGIGIPSHALEYIFDEFRQVDAGSTRQFGGTGLGLAIVRNLTTMMQGTVNATSKVNEGSTFTVTLPLEAVNIPTVEQVKDQ